MWAYGFWAVRVKVLDCLRALLWTPLDDAPTSRVAFDAASQVNNNLFDLPLFPRPPAPPPFI